MQPSKPPPKYNTENETGEKIAKIVRSSAIAAYTLEYYSYQPNFMAYFRKHLIEEGNLSKEECADNWGKTLKHLEHMKEHPEGGWVGFCSSISDEECRGVLAMSYVYHDSKHFHPSIVMFRMMNWSQLEKYAAELDQEVLPVRNDSFMGKVWQKFNELRFLGHEDVRRASGCWPICGAE